MKQEIIDVLSDIVELGYVEVSNGSIVKAVPPKNNLCHYRWDRWTPTLKYINDYASNHSEFEGEFFVCLYDGWREYSKPSGAPVFVPWESISDKSKYLANGNVGEPRFRHARDTPCEVYPCMPLPVITYNAHARDVNTILIPDAEFIEGHYKRYIDEVLCNDIPWEAKIDAPVWRGSRNITSGFEYEYLGTNGLHPREYLVRHGGYNASFHPTSITVQLQCKYILDVDGMVNAWSGLYWKLLSNSVVVKHSSHWKQWYYDQLEPWVHYVPLENFEDLPKVLDWCKNNDDVCKNIAMNATKFIKMLDYNYATTQFRIGWPASG